MSDGGLFLTQRGFAASWWLLALIMTFGAGVEFQNGNFVMMGVAMAVGFVDLGIAVSETRKIYQ